VPLHRRHRYGDEIRDVFTALAADAHASAGARGVSIAFLRELGGLMRFALRERFAALRTTSRWSPASELRWAWRALTARRRQAAFGVALLGVTLGANGVIFSVADSLAFMRDNYPDGERLVVLQGFDPETRRTITGLPADLVEPVRAQRDLVDAVHATTGSSVLLSRGGVPVNSRAIYVTPGLFEMLGARPLAGRTFVDADAGANAATLVVIREDLAREHFGDPTTAVGRTLDAATGPLHVIGVMPASFRFQSGNDRIWRPLDLKARTSSRVPSLFVIARRAPDATADRLSRALMDRSPAITPLTAMPRGWPYTIATAPFGDRFGVAPSRVYAFLLAAAVCLLLTACASVASVELSTAVRRGRSFALTSALGASRAAIVRIVALETAFVTVAAVAIGAVLAAWGTSAVAAALPDSLTLRSTNAIDVDTRALLFMAAAGAIAWLVAAVPVLHFAVRQSTIATLTLDSRTTAGSRGAALARRSLAALQVAIAVCLLIGATLGLRSYLALITLDKGFDSRSLIGVEVTIPPSMPRTAAAIEATTTQVLDRLRSLSVVAGAAAAVEVPPLVWGDRYAGPVEIGGQEPAGMAITIRSRVAADYFDVLRLPLRAGRIFAADEPTTSAIVPETFAAQYWPGQSVVGKRFKQPGDQSWLEIVGVSARVRSELDNGGAPSRVEHQIYVPRRPLTAAETTNASGNPFAYYTVAFVVRLTDVSAAPAVVEAVRALDGRLLARADVVDDLYAQLFTDTRVATSVITAFGVLAFAISLAGIYGVMAFLVAGRRRELAIRLALGAGAADVQRQVVASALRFVLLGAAAGLVTAWSVARFIESQLFAVSARDVATYAGVAAAVIIAAVVATWRPARRAARIDPALTLRTD
jgi:predicted permease